MLLARASDVEKSSDLRDKACASFLGGNVKEY